MSNRHGRSSRHNNNFQETWSGIVGGRRAIEGAPQAAGPCPGCELWFEAQGIPTVFFDFVQDGPSLFQHGCQFQPYRPFDLVKEWLAAVKQLASQGYQMEHEIGKHWGKPPGEDHLFGDPKVFHLFAGEVEWASAPGVLPKVLPKVGEHHCGADGIGESHFYGSRLVRLLSGFAGEVQDDSADGVGGIAAIFLKFTDAVVASVGDVHATGNQEFVEVDGRESGDIKGVGQGAKDGMIGFAGFGLQQATRPVVQELEAGGVVTSRQSGEIVCGFGKGENGAEKGP